VREGGWTERDRLDTAKRGLVEYIEKHGHMEIGDASHVSE